MIAVAMSGGLDSSVVAWLLSRNEEPVVGLSMQLWDMSAEARNGRCCGALDLGDAKRVAQQAGIPHYTLDMEEDFRLKVVDPFVSDYLEGRTPIPCTGCNTSVKFDLLFERARTFGVERIATGHYARILEGSGGFELHTAVDLSKDQSYYLFELTQQQLAASMFPLGAMHKTEVRELARQGGLVVAEKGESMEICFVPGGIREFVEEQVEKRPEDFSRAAMAVGAEDARSVLDRPARLVDSEGQKLGEGEPYYRYTVGQRRGLGVAASERLYVIGVQPQKNEITVGSADALSSRGLIGGRCHWIGEDLDQEFDQENEIEATVKIRSRHPGATARIRRHGRGEEGRVEVEFAEPQRGVTPGQAAVFQRGSRVLGGCWIEKSLS